MEIHWKQSIQDYLGPTLLDKCSYASAVSEQKTIYEAAGHLCEIPHGS